MSHRPKWRAPLATPRKAVMSPAFLAAREKFRGTGVKCHCGAFALRGAKVCKRHGGLLSAAAAEAERYGRPVMILRNPRKRAQAKLGAEMAWPDSIPKTPELLALGVLARGRLFEAWLNRGISPGQWKDALAWYSNGGLRGHLRREGEQATTQR